MKSSELKKLIKDAVQEAIKDELRDILLEAVRANKNSPPLMENQHINFSQQIPNPGSTSKAPSTLIDQRKAYADILNSMSRNGDTMNFDTQGMGLSHIPSDTVSEGSSLPAGDVSLDMIMNLTGIK
jgi:hypothetical protein